MPVDLSGVDRRHHIRLNKVVAAPVAERETTAVLEVAKAVPEPPVPVAVSTPPAKLRKAAFRYHFAGGRILGELLVESEGFANGYLLDLGRGTSTVTKRVDAERIAKRFSIEGDRYIRSMRSGVGVSRVARFPLERIAADVSATSNVVDVAKADVEYGLWDDNTREYFLTGALAGRVVIERSASGAVTLSIAPGLPRVLEPDAVRKGLMPPAGFSGLPASLESVVPAAYRYWLAKGEDAARVREALVASGFFTPSNVQLVAGELRRVVTKTFLYQPSIKEPVRKRAVPDVFAARVGRLLPADVEQYFHPFLASDWRAAVTKADREGAFFVLSPPSADPAKADEIAEVAKGLKGDWLIDVADSPEARRALTKVGDPFKLAAPLADGHLFVTSYPIPVPAAVERVAPPDAVDVGLSFQVRKAFMRKDSNGEQRLVLGIVLEPEVVDAQGDIYSAAEIEQAAHHYMEEFRNRGLMHEQNVNDRVQLAESYIAPVDMQIGEQVVKAGTWLMVQHVLDDGLWGEVKKGALTGFSIGGSAVRVKEARAAVKSLSKADAVANPATREFAGIALKIDRPKGFVQTGVDAAGTEWARTYKTDYGFIPKTDGGDGEDLDVFLGDDAKANTAFWVRQNKWDGTFDEYKVFLGFGTALDVRKVYNAHIPAKLWGGVFSTPVASIRALLGVAEVELAKALGEPIDLTKTDDVPHTTERS